MERNLAAFDNCHAKSWEYLKAHAVITSKFAMVLEVFAEGKMMRAEMKMNLWVEHRSTSALGESQRDSGAKPRVARNELPWVVTTKNHEPQRGFGREGVGLAGRNPVGVGIYRDGTPRVARSSQPWAGGRNPVGIHCARTVIPNRSQTP